MRQELTTTKSEENWFEERDAWLGLISRDDHQAFGFRNRTWTPKLILARRYTRSFGTQRSLHLTLVNWILKGDIKKGMLTSSSFTSPHCVAESVSAQ